MRINDLKVCHLSTVHKLYDPRIFYKECTSLSEFGYKVYYIVSNEESCVLNGVRVIPLPTFEMRFPRIFFKPVLALLKSIMVNAHVYHLHDPELIPVGFILKFLGKKVIFDLHELFEYQLYDKEWLPYWLKVIVRKIYFLLRDLYVKIFDAVILAEDRYIESFSKYRNYRHKIFKIRNYPILDRVLKYSENRTRRNGNGELFVVGYNGVLARVRGIKEMIKAVEKLDDSVRLFLVGRWSDEKYREECFNMKGWEKVKYFGYKKLDEVYEIVSKFDVGMTVSYPIKNHTTTMHVKTFEFMALGIPMILSNFDYWKEVYAGCALFVDPYDPEDIANKIEMLKKDEGLREKLGNTGKKLVLEKYSWENEKKRLFGIYKVCLGIKDR